MVNTRIFIKFNPSSKEFFDEYGYIHYRVKSRSYLNKVNKCFEYYANNLPKKNQAFRNTDNKSRHIIDTFRDKASNTLSLYKETSVEEIINHHIDKNKRYIFTHAKMSFKQTDSNSDWYPHQDNGYKLEGDIRKGFAVFICLEDMNEDNGCLQVYPSSNKLGMLEHERIIEDPTSGDNQFKIVDLPVGFEPLSIIAEKGDILILSCNTIHQSLSSRSESQRLALISEIEEFNTIKLDDYGKSPILFSGDFSFKEVLTLMAMSSLNKQKIWNIIKRNQNLARLVRKIRYKKSKKI